jgi:hypothetical protein
VNGTTPSHPSNNSLICNTYFLTDPKRTILYKRRSDPNMKNLLVLMLASLLAATATAQKVTPLLTTAR